MDGLSKRIPTLLAAVALAALLLVGGRADAQSVVPLAAGNFTAPAGIAVDGTGDVFVVDTSTSTVKEILAPGYTTVNTLATATAHLNAPKGVAVDVNGNVFIADTGNNQVKEILAPGYTTVNILASSFGAFNRPTGIAVDHSGNIFVADQGNGVVKELSPTDSYSTSNAIGLGLFSTPSGVSVDATDNLFIVDPGKGAVFEVLAAGSYTTARKLSPATGAGNIVQPFAVATDVTDNVFAADTSTSQIYGIPATGSYATVNLLAAGSFAGPTGLAADSRGNLFVGDTNHGAVKEIIRQTATTLGTSLTPIARGSSVTFTATVTGNSGTPTGSVTFLDGATALGTTTLGAGAATFTTSSLGGGSHSITAKYLGSTDSIYATSTSAIVSEVVTPTVTSTSLAAAPNPSQLGQSVTFTATVSGTGGNVTFKDGTATLGTVNLTAGSAAFTTASLTKASHSITAAYNGSANFATSTSNTVTQIVNGDPSATSVISSANPSTSGQPVTFTAFVSAPNGSPTGSVTFMDGGTTLGSSTLASGIASYTTSGLSVTSHAITANYGGDPTFAASVSTTLSQTVNAPGLQPSLTAVGAVPNPSLSGQTVTFTATVSGSGGTPTGTVTFRDGTTTLGAATLAGGAASFSTASLTIGSHAISAGYGGDAKFAAGTSTAVTETVTQPPTTITLVSSPNPSSVGQQVTFTATASGNGGTPTGTITFRDGAATLGAATLAGGSANFSLSSLTLGSHAISAGYGGDGTFAAATSAVLTETITQPPSSVTLASSPNPSTVGQLVTFTATILSSGGNPTGTVTFSEGGTLLGTGTLASGMASITTAALPIGSDSITASYAGDGSFAASGSAILTQVVEANSIAGFVYGYQNTLGATAVPRADNTHFDGPIAGAVDTANGHLFVADSDNQRVQVLDTTTLAVIATIGTTGVSGADNAHFNQPESVGLNSATGRLFVADSANQRVQIFDAKSFAYLATLGTSGTAGTDAAHFNLPSSAYVNAAAQQLYVADTGNQRVQIFDAGSLDLIATLGTTGAAGSDPQHLDQPTDAELDVTTNQILVADGGNFRVQLFDAASFFYVTTLGTTGTPGGDNTHFNLPVSAAFDPTTNLVLVADGGNNDRVQVFDAMTYQYVLTLGTVGTAGPGQAQFGGPQGFAVDPVHQRLFIGDGANDRVQIYAIAPTVTLAAVLPDSRSVQVGTPATIFASILNAGATALDNCRIALPVTAPSGLILSYQTTDAATNTLTGSANTPATIHGANGVQSYLITLQDTLPFSAPGMVLDFDCTGAAPAAIVTGVDTVDLVMSTTPVADVIVLAATSTGDGVLQIPTGGAAAFAVASVNVGVPDALTASLDTGTASLPLSATLCQSNPSTGQCLATPTAELSLTIAAGATPTFSVFVQATGPIPFAPGTSRLFLRFKDQAGGLHGSTSVAVETE